MPVDDRALRLAGSTSVIAPAQHDASTRPTAVRHQADHQAAQARNQLETSPKPARNQPDHQPDTKLKPGTASPEADDGCLSGTVFDTAAICQRLSTNRAAARYSLGQRCAGADQAICNQHGYLVGDAMIPVLGVHLHDVVCSCAGWICKYDSMAYYVLMKFLHVWERSTHVQET